MTFLIASTTATTRTMTVDAAENVSIDLVTRFLVFGLTRFTP